jgi:hypothetical protein
MGSGSKYGFEKTTGLVIQQGIFEESATAKHALGTRMQLADGRVFHYALAGGTLAAGKMCISTAPPSGHEDVDTSAQSAGDKEITVTVNTTAVTANMYAEGYISTRETGGVGQTFKIRKNTATTETTGTSTLTLYDPIKTALLATGQADLLPNPFYKVTHSAAEENGAAGVPLIAVTSGYYFWLQTFGPATCLCDGSIPLGIMVVLGTVAGSVAAITAATNDWAKYAYPIVGSNIGAAGVDTKYTTIHLRLYS